MLNFLDHANGITESRWIAKSNLFDDVKAIIHKEIMKPDMDFQDFLTVDENGVEFDDTKAMTYFSRLGSRIENQVEPVIHKLFKTQLPFINEKKILFQVTVDFSDKNTKGMINPVGTKHQRIDITLNIASILKSATSKKLRLITKEISKMDYKRFIVKKIVEDWSATIVHECTHVAQALAFKAKNLGLYEKNFMIRSYSSPKVRRHRDIGGMISDPSIYYTQTQEIQAHAVAAGSRMVRMMTKETALKFVDEYEKTILKKPIRFNPPGKDPVEIFLMSLLDDTIEIDLMKAKKSLDKRFLKRIQRYGELEEYGLFYLIGKIDRKSMARFLRDLRTTIRDMPGN